MINHFKINLQLFAGEKTEKATPRRREEARKKGQVSKSNEIITVIVLTLSLLVLKMWLPQMMVEFKAFFANVFNYAGNDLTVENASLLIYEVLLLTLKMVGPVVLTALVAGYVANVGQVGFLFTTEPLKFDLNRINPISGLKRILSKRALAELVKSVLKTVLVGFIAVSFLLEQLPRLTVLMDYPLMSAITVVGDVIFSALWRIILVLLVLAVLDFAYQRYEYEQSLKMSKQEIKEEYKTIEGDPQLKAKIKERQRQLATRRMMHDVPKATVVITNPTHYAVALQYTENMSAPVVVAKGQDQIALKIKEIARENNVVMVENKPLARLLYQKVEIGEAIPAELYQAVAEVLAYVYRMKRRT